jgi:MFS family permease
MWTLLVGRGWLAYELSGSSTWVGLVTFAGFLPFILAPFGGVLADSSDRRKLAAFSTAISFLLTLLLAVLELSDRLTLSYLVLLTFVMSLPRAAELPARQSLIPNVVPRNDLLNALSLSSVATFGTRAAGPALVIPLIETIAPGGVFLLSAAFYGLSTALILSVETRSVGGASAGRAMMSEIGEGLSYIISTRPIAVLMLLVAFHCSLTMAFDSLLPVFAVQRLMSHGASFSALAMGVGAGALVGTLAISGLRGTKEKGQALLVTGVLSGITPMGMALPMELMNVTNAVLLTAAMGATQGAFMALAGAMVQDVAPDGLRGRVSSIYLLFAGGLMAWVNLLNGALADVWEVPYLFIVPALIYLGLLAAMMISGSRLKSIFRTGQLVQEPSSAAP